MRKLIKRFKEWLIRKLGGYTLPMAEYKVYRPKPIDLYAQVAVPREINVSEAEITGQLAYEIAEEIKDKKLYDLKWCHKFETNEILYRMRVCVVEPHSGVII